MTNPNLDFRAVLIEGAYKLIEQGAIAYIRNIKMGEGPVSPDTRSKPEPSTCHVCEVHKNVALAHSYIEGLYKRLNPDGSIPAGLGGTLKLAQQHIDSAMEEIPQLLGFNDKIDQACMSLGRELPGLMIALNHVSSREEMEDILARSERAKDLAYAVPEAMYRREAPHTKTEDIPDQAPLTPEDRELLALVRDARTGTISKQEVLERLSLMLLHEDNNG